MLVLNTKTRDKKINLNALRKDGFIPAVYYGRTQASTPIAVSLRDFEKTWKTGGESSVITLEDEKKRRLEALIHDIDLDPLTNRPRHVDFYVFEEDKTIEVSIPLEFVGVAPVVKNNGAVLVKVLRELNVEAMPRSIPNSLDVDISGLDDFESQVLAGDIKLPKDVTLMEDPEEVVAAVSRPQEEVEPEETEDVDFSSIEVEKKGKEDEDGGEAEKGSSDTEEK